jgi:hypothetical protein
VAAKETIAKQELKLQQVTQIRYLHFFLQTFLSHQEPTQTHINSHVHIRAVYQPRCEAEGSHTEAIGEGRRQRRHIGNEDGLPEADAELPTGDSGPIEIL